VRLAYAALRGKTYQFLASLYTYLHAYASVAHKQVLQSSLGAVVHQNWFVDSVCTKLHKTRDAMQLTSAFLKACSVEQAAPHTRCDASRTSLAKEPCAIEINIPGWRHIHLSAAACCELLKELFTVQHLDATYIRGVEELSYNGVPPPVYCTIV
jgi:hypothetical protein